MIQFPCRCGHRFSVPEDMAAGLVQCPTCGRLNDVPTLSDLKNINEDGTFKDIPLAPDDDPDRAQTLDLVFRPGRLDQAGDEIDLRPTIDDVRRSGVEQKPLDLRDDAPRTAPKYDPDTGELIDPMAMSPEKPVPAIPVGSAQALSYASATTYVDRPITPARVPVALFMPANIAVLIILFLAHLLMNFLVLACASGMLFVAPLPIAILLLILAHFGNVIDDVGRCDHDELPSLMRHASWREDVWMPFAGLMAALMLCYGPAALVLHLTQSAAAGVALAIAGSVFFPAVLMTSICSETGRNLRPDRLLSVMRACGGWYLLMVPLGMLAMVVYFVGLAGTALAAADLSPLSVRSDGRLVYPVPVSYGMLVLGLYLMHLFCWYLGLIYRGFNEKFDWVWQRHVYTRSLERVGKAPPGANAQK